MNNQSSDINANITTNRNIYTNILLIHNSLKDFQIIYDSVNCSTYPIIYSNVSLKFELLAILQNNFINITRIGFVFESCLNDPMIENIQSIINIIKTYRIHNIDYLACNTLNNIYYTNYYDILKSQTSVLIGASKNKIGNNQYGGTWFLETIQQDIKFVYFTENIEQYKYLFSEPNINTWITLSGNPAGGIAIDNQNNYMYIYNIGSTYISKISIGLTNGTYSILNWVNLAIYVPNGIAIDSTGEYLYVSTTNNTNSRIIRIKTSDGSVIADWATSASFLQSAGGIIIDNTDTYLYMANYDITYVGQISQITIGNTSNSTADAINASWSPSSPSTLAQPLSLTLNSTGEYLYIAQADPNYGYAIIAQIVMDGTSTPISHEYTWGTISTQNMWPYGICIDNTGTNLYITDVQHNNVIKLPIVDDGGPAPGAYEESWIATIISPFAISFDANNNNLYISDGNNNIYQIPFLISCFVKNTNILTINGYQQIQNLKSGDIVLTPNGYKKVAMIGYSYIYHNKNKNTNDQLYILKKDKYPKLFDDLIITGNHSILEDDKGIQTYIEDIKKHMNNIIMINSMHRLPAFLDNRTEIYDKSGTYTIYHLALENDSDDMFDGIYANGLLVESTCIRDIKNNMVIL